MSLFALGRTTGVTLPDGASTTTYVYSGNTVKVTDPEGHWKKYTSDAFGNVSQVNEPNPGGGMDYVTTDAPGSFALFRSPCRSNGNFSVPFDRLSGLAGQLAGEHPVQAPDSI